MPATSEKIETCLLCQSSLKTILQLSPTAPANELLDQDDPDKELYNLNLMQCQLCKHLQIDTEISKFRLFKHYVYTSNTSASNYAYFQQYARVMKEKFTPKFVVDIGSNDGLFLSFFQDSSETLGVDPAENVVKIAEANGVETICAYFNEMQGLNIAHEYGKADLITCNNMFAHNRNLDEVVKGIKLLLSSTGTFVFEVSYAQKLLDNNLFDLIYHEHIHHWHVATAVKYMTKLGLKVYDAEQTSTHGGSIRIYAVHDNNLLVNQSDRLKEILLQENRYFQQSVDTFKTKIEKLKENITQTLTQIKSEGKTISILGYPAKACTLSYYLGLDKNLITNVYDDNVLKIGKYSHLGFKIKPAVHIYKDKPDYLLILSWNYANELMESHKLFHRTGGKFIVPLPKLRII